METPATDPAPPALEPPPPPFDSALEAVELELSLGQKEIGEEQFETAIRETVEAVGGVLLFQMRLDDLDDRETARWVAAVAFGQGQAHEIAIIDLPCGGGEVSVRPAAESDLPIAAIAPAYAGLAECWAKAA